MLWNRGWGNFQVDDLVLYFSTWIINFSLMDQQETSENPDVEIEFLEDDFEEVVDFGDEGDNGEGI